MYLHARRIASVPIRRCGTADRHRNEPTGNRQFYGTVFAVFVQFAIAATTGRHFVTHPDPKARQNRMQNQQQGVSFSLTPRSGAQTRFLSPESQETGRSFCKGHETGNPFPPSHEASRTSSGRLWCSPFSQKFQELPPFSTPPPAAADFPSTGHHETAGCDADTLPATDTKKRPSAMSGTRERPFFRTRQLQHKKAARLTVRP